MLRGIACSSARAPCLLSGSLRLPQMSAIALGGFSAGFSGGLSGGFSTGVENAGECLPNDGLFDIIDLLRKVELTDEQKVEIYFLIKKYLGSVQ